MTVDRTIKAGAAAGIRTLEAVAAASSDINNVTVFTKFIKRAEEAAQAAL